MVTVRSMENTLKMLEEELENLEEMSGDAVGSWYESCNSSIEELKTLMKTSLTNGEKRKCQTVMTHLTRLQVKLDSYLRRGGNLEQSKDINARVQWREVDSAFQNRIKTGVIVNLKHIDIQSFMEDAREIFNIQLQKYLTEHNSVKVSAELVAEYIIQKSEEEVSDVKYFSSESAAIFESTDLNEWFLEKVKDPILNMLEEFQERDSGWTLKSILSLVINMKKFSPMRGSSFIALPPFIHKKHACVNVKNEDDQCFKWAILSALYPQERNPDRVQKYYPFESQLNFHGIDFPVTLKHVKKFEKQNDVSVNVYMLKKSGRKFEVSPCHVSAMMKLKHVNLLILQDYYIDEEDDSVSEDEGGIPKFHYVWIKSMSRLLSSQVSSTRYKSFHCGRCLHFFYSREKLETHELLCSSLDACKIVLPREKDKILKFQNHSRNVKVPIVIYADFECLLRPTDDGKKFQKHEAYSIGYYMKCSFDDSLSKYKSYRMVTEEEKTPAEWFVEELRTIAEEMEKLYENPVPMRLSDLEEISFHRATICHICRKSFCKEDEKVRDHCHLTGSFRGAAHNSCNLKYQDSRHIPVIFHNLSNYDSHFIIQEVATSPNFKGVVTLLPENKEKYISFTKYLDGSRINFRFIDSFRFLPSSLDKLSSYLTDIPHTRLEFQKDGDSISQIDLLKRKGIFPYDYVDSLEKLNETKLPEKEEFYNKLTDSSVSDEDYQHALNVWETFNVKSLGAYSDRYLKTDVLLLTDVFESFRAMCLRAYDLEPAWYVTIPSLTWDAMLKYTKIELELMTDIDMMLFVEKGIRGGISQCSSRYAKANNQYMGEKYDKNKEDEFLMYYDINNLYGWAMIQSLPTGSFTWEEIEHVPNFWKTSDDSPIGYFAEVDLEYPEELHDKHQDLPLCPEHRIPPGSKQYKLMTTLHDKKRYLWLTGKTA